MEMDGEPQELANPFAGCGDKSMIIFVKNRRFNQGYPS
jgi:hypothetical protein